MTTSQKIVQISAVGKKKKAKTAYIQELKEEMKKVSWTTKEELVLCTKIVIGTIFTLGLGIYIVDLVIRNVLLGITNITHLITS
mgnify:CR=1 FL=1